MDYQIGGRKPIMFVMFPGFGSSKKCWDQYFEKDKKINTNFITELKKICAVYFHEPLYHNMNYYRKDKYKILYDKNIDFTKDNFDVVKECEALYQEIKDFKGIFVPIGHSIGSYFVYCFGQKYKSKCLFSVNIDGSPIGPIEQTLNDQKYLYPKIEKYKKYDDTMIDTLKKKVYEGNEKAIDKLFSVAIYNIYMYKQITNKAAKLEMPMIGFYNIKIDQKNKNGPCI